jgi:hypothetical protein
VRGWASDDFVSACATAGTDPPTIYATAKSALINFSIVKTPPLKRQYQPAKPLFATRLRRTVLNAA